MLMGFTGLLNLESREITLRTFFFVKQRPGKQVLVSLSTSSLNVANVKTLGDGLQLILWFGSVNFDA